MFGLTISSLDIHLLHSYVLCVGFFVSFRIDPNGILSFNFSFQNCTLQPICCELPLLHKPSLLDVGTASPSFRYVVLYRLNFLYLPPNTPGARPPSLLLHDRFSLSELEPTQLHYTEAFTFAHTQCTGLVSRNTLGELPAGDVYSMLHSRLNSKWFM